MKSRAQNAGFLPRMGGATQVRVLTFIDSNPVAGV